MRNDKAVNLAIYIRLRLQGLTLFLEVLQGVCVNACIHLAFWNRRKDVNHIY